MTGDNNSRLEHKELSAVRPALFLDRDGVINMDKGYVHRPDGFEFIDGAPETIQRFNDMGWRVFVVTNQTGIAHGFYTEADMFYVHAHMQSELKSYNAHIDRIYYCPYDTRGMVARYILDSEDRKPHPGMLLKAMENFPTDASRSFLIGDKRTDIEAAQAAGIRGFLFKGGNLFEFASSVLEELGETPSNV